MRENIKICLQCFFCLPILTCLSVDLQTLDRIDFNEPISPSLERRVLTTIISICESYLEQYPTSLDEDEKFMVIYYFLMIYV
jgi:Rubisco LSMT substrate-binding